MAGLIIHSQGNMQGWRPIDMPPLTELSAQCPCCDGKITEVYRVSDNDNSLGVICCDYCGYVGYDQLPTQEWLDDHYAGEWMAGESLDPAPRDPLANILLQTVPKDKSILEIGCGKGSCLAVLRNNGYQNIAGVEQCQHRAEASARHTGLDINSDWPDGEWDVVTSHHVLEHFRDPNDFFTQARERQPNGGFIVLVVPKADWEPLLGQLLFLLHLHSFSGDALAMLAHKNGYQKIADASTATCVIHIYNQSQGRLPDCLGFNVSQMHTKISRGLKLQHKAKEQQLRWRIFDTYATYYPIKDPHRSLVVSSTEENHIHFESDQCMFVK